MVIPLELIFWTPADSKAILSAAALYSYSIDSKFLE